MIRFWTFIPLALALVSAIAPVTLAASKTDPAKTAEDARNAAASLDKPSDAPFWVPAARLATDKPQRIEVNNNTGVTLEYLITTHTDFRTLAPGKSVTLTNFSTPMFLNINPQESNYLVAYKVSVNAKTNTLIVNITLTRNPDNRTLNLDETGAVYLY
jgi:hypothetical protein